MKTASVRELRQNFPQIMEWIADGEQVAVTMRRKVVARLVPEYPPEKIKPSCPDFESKSREIFGDRIFPDDVIETEREGYRF